MENFQFFICLFYKFVVELLPGFNNVCQILVLWVLWTLLSCQEKLVLPKILHGICRFNMKREFVMRRRIIIYRSTRRSMFRICRWSSWCRALNPRSLWGRHSRGCTITGTLPMMESSIWGLTSIFHRKLCPPPWRNPPSPSVALRVVRPAIAHGSASIA